MSLERIVLAGFMGSGKSTIGRLLAAELGWSFVDLDTEIELVSGQTVPGLFAEHGEAYFRRVESDVLGKLLALRSTVIALGGGAPEIEANRELLEASADTCVVFLKAPFEVLFERCAEQALDPEATARPILANRDEAELRFARRAEHYHAIAHEIVETASLSATATVAHLLARLELN
ncbi:MAG: shikimate kinase [Acidobacteriaceae bacterium]|nr:shikimate kinase [Acidobacteriaceae bacterium]